MLSKARQWRAGIVVAWAGCGLAWLLPPALVMMAAFGVHTQAMRLAEQQAKERQARERLTALLAQQALPAPTAPVQDFAQRLPEEVSSLPAISLIRRAAEAHGVEVQTLSASEQRPAPTALGHLSVEVGLKGGYGPLKKVLADVLERDRGSVVVRSVAWRRPGVAPDMEMRAVLSWPTRPAKAPAANATRSPQQS